MILKTVSIQQARDLLLKGGVVAIPTETVYGLGGWIFSEEGLKKIFSTKERPFFDPLIVHVDSKEKAKALTREWSNIHEALVEVCWPGPLTLIAPKNEKVSPLITSGLESVGLRCPSHPKALELLSLVDGGIAAPSANKFGKTSPTTSHHVFEEFGDAVSIIEGGQSEVGIESTVAGVSGNRVEIYRPGFYTATALETILKKKGISVEVRYAESPVAPGQLKHHYMPKIPLVIVPENFNPEAYRGIISFSFKNPKVWKQPETPELASRELYQKMREFDQAGFDIIFAEKDARSLQEDWKGLWNRLEKAKSASFL